MNSDGTVETLDELANTINNPDDIFAFKRILNILRGSGNGDKSDSSFFTAIIPLFFSEIKEHKSLNKLLDDSIKAPHTLIDYKEMRAIIAINDESMSEEKKEILRKEMNALAIQQVENVKNRGVLSLLKTTSEDARSELSRQQKESEGITK